MKHRVSIPLALIVLLSTTALRVVGAANGSNADVKPRDLTGSPLVSPY